MQSARRVCQSSAALLLYRAVLGLSHTVAAGTIQIVIAPSHLSSNCALRSIRKNRKNQEPDAISCATVLDRPPTASQNLSLLPKRVR